MEREQTFAPVIKEAPVSRDDRAALTRVPKRGEAGVPSFLSAWHPQRQPLQPCRFKLAGCVTKER